MTSEEKIQLTQTVQKGGCAAKIAAAELRRLLAKVRFPKPHPELLVDGSHFDDAAIYKVNDEIAMVQTLDFFTPIVDSPKYFGQIAAANALSDVYAMGGRPRTAMAILAFPLATMPESVIVEVLQGASDKIQEANSNFVGGHSIDDDTLKFGLSVTGYVDPRKVWSNVKATAGDDLILTKALGTGTLTAALKRREKTEEEIHEAMQSMSQLNNIIDFLDSESLQAIHAATDITGFGLAGHASQMAKASGCIFEIMSESLPRFSLSFECLEKKFLTKAHRTNKEYIAATTLWKKVPESQMILFESLICDPQTSGGLLLSVDPKRTSAMLQKLRPVFPHAEKIGRVLQADPRPTQNHIDERNQQTFLMMV